MFRQVSNSCKITWRPTENILSGSENAMNTILWYYSIVSFAVCRYSPIRPPVCNSWMKSEIYILRMNFFLNCERHLHGIVSEYWMDKAAA